MVGFIVSYICFVVVVFLGFGSYYRCLFQHIYKYTRIYSIFYIRDHPTHEHILHAFYSYEGEQNASSTKKTTTNSKEYQQL